MNRLTTRVASLTAATALAGAGLAAFTASPSSAHTGDLKVTAVCNTTTGNYDLTAKLTTSSVPSNVTGSSKWRVGTSTFQGTPTSDAGMDRGPVSSTGNTTVTLGSWTLPGTTTGLGPWVYAYTKWSNGTKRGSDGQLTQKLNGDCKKPDVKVTITKHAVVPPTCESAGRLDVFAQPAGAITKVNGTTVTPPKSYGPGTYAVAYSAQQGYVLNNNPSETVTVLDKLDPNTNPDCRPDQPPNVKRFVPGSAEGCALPGYGAGRLSWNDLYEDYYVWDETSRSYVLVQDTTPTRVNEQFVAYTQAELVAKGCVTPPPVPPVQTCPDGSSWTDTNGNGLMDECDSDEVITGGKGTVLATCVSPTRGEGVAWGKMRARNTAATPVVVKQGGKTLAKRSVNPRRFFRIQLKDVKVSDKPVKLYIDGKLADKDKVEKGCKKPDTPHVGLRVRDQINKVIARTKGTFAHVKRIAARAVMRPSAA